MAPQLTSPAPPVRPRSAPALSTGNGMVEVSAGVGPRGKSIGSPVEPFPSEWANTPLKKRLAWVRQFRKLIIENTDRLSELTQDEVHKPAHEALLADIAPLVASCRWHERFTAGVLAKKSLPGTPFWLRQSRTQIHRAPLGRIGIIATWNYPVQLLGIQLVQALVAGNTVVVKPSELAPQTQSYLLNLAELAGLPSGTLTRLEATREEGERLVRQEPLDHLIFTGSTRVGLQIAQAAAARLLPTTLELSGNDSAIVLHDADPDLAARVVWFGVTANAGQTCMAPRRVLVDQSIYARFLAALAPLAAGATPRTLISGRAAQQTFELVADAVSCGGRSLSGVLEGPIGPASAILRPIAVVDCPRDSALVAGDHFGPAVAVVPVRDFDDALRVHRRLDLSTAPQHLSVSLFGRDTPSLREKACTLGASFVTINDCLIPQSHPGSSIRGQGASGWGSSRGIDGLRAMTQAIAISRTRGLSRPPTDPPTPRQLAFLKSAMIWLYR